MTLAVTSPVTGPTNITGLTSPTYTIVQDVAPNNNSKQWAVSALGGTQTGVSVHSGSKPFTVTVSRPANVRVAPVPNPVTGVIAQSPRNTVSIITRKGAVPALGQSPQVAILRTDIQVVAGTDLQDPAEVKAGWALHAGVVAQQTGGMADSMLTMVI